MTNSKKTKRVLLTSILSMILCFSMLVGSTFAWFTDTDTTAVSNIVAGTLDIEIVDENGDEHKDALKFVAADERENILWEPGATYRTEGFQIKNVGNLWLKYKIAINNTEVSYNKLNEVIDFYLVTVNDEGTADKVDLATMKDISLEPNTTSGTLMYLEGHMDENAGNEYQGLTLNGVSITVYATQYTSEVDKDDKTYDEGAIYDDEIVTVATADDFINAFAELEDGGIIALTANIDMTGKNWTPVNNKSFTLDGNDYTIKGLNGPLVGTTAAKEYTVKDVTFKNMVVNGVYGGIAIGGVIAYADTCSYINMENVTIDGATITGAEYVGGFAGYTSGYGVDTNGPVNASHNFTNCTIKNATLTSSTGGSVGGLIGHAGSNAATTTRINGFAYSGLVLAQTDADRPDKTGNMIGTANVGVVYIDDADIDVTYDIGRFVPGSTGKLVINSVEQTAFENTAVDPIIPDSDVMQDGKVDNTEFKNLLSVGGNGVISLDGAQVDYYYGVTIDEPITIQNMNSKGIYMSTIKADTIFENCTFTATESKSYHAFNVDTGDGKITFRNCTFNGWIAMNSGITDVVFENCTFSKNGVSYNFINSYQNMTFTGCNFGDGFGIDDESPAQQNWIFTNCTGLSNSTLNETGTYETVSVVIDGVEAN